MQFLEINNDLVLTLIATILSTYVNNLLESIFTYIIKPFINFDFNKDGISDINNLEEFHIILSGKKIYLGKVILSFIELILIMYTLQLLKKHFIKN